MNVNPILELTLQEILQVIKPVRSDWDARSRVIDQLRSVLESVESLKGATIQPFGSFVSNLFTRWGDLDISVDLFSGPSILYAGKKQKQTLLGHLLRALRNAGGFNKLQFIVHARVPILKAVSNIQRISCDVSIDNLEGLLKSRFLFWISEIDGRFRDMVLLVKEWAKAHNINNPKTGTFNSYSLSLLVIFHFQTCVPAILPPLREIYPRSAVDDLKGVRKIAEESIAQISAANIAKFRANTSRSVNRSSLSELFVSFFAKFSNINSKAGELGVCPFTGRWENISNNTRWLPKTYSLFVEDPFEQPQNAARSVSRKNLNRIAEVFKMTWHSLASDFSRDSILDMLTELRISQSLLRKSIASPSHHHVTGAHNARNLQGQAPFHDQSRPPHPRSYQMQQNWFPNNAWNLQGHTPVQGPYWQTPIPAQRPQNWSQNNRRNLQGKTPVQGQTWPVTPQTPTQQGQYMNGKRPVQGQTRPVTTQAPMQQGQGQYMNGIRAAQGQTWAATTQTPTQPGQYMNGKRPVQGQTWPVTTQIPTQQGQYRKGKGSTKNRSNNTGIPPNSAGSSQNQGHIAKLPGHVNGLNSGRPGPKN